MACNRFFDHQACDCPSCREAWLRQVRGTRREGAPDHAPKPEVDWRDTPAGGPFR